MPGTVEQIAIASVRGELPVRVERVRATEGEGLEGEYHRRAADVPITLIDAEALEGLRAGTGIELSHEASRRNVLTRGVDLNALVGRRFAVGGVECEGVELCEPCNRLAKLTERGVLRGLVHSGGLRANLLSSGEIAVCDPVRAL